MKGMRSAGVWVVLLALTPVAHAAGKAAVKKAEKPTTLCAANAKVAKGAKAPVRKSGRILSVELDEELVTLEGIKGKNIELQITELTRLTAGAKYKAVSLKDLKKGDPIFYVLQGEDTACIHVEAAAAKTKPALAPVPKAAGPKPQPLKPQKAPVVTEDDESYIEETSPVGDEGMSEDYAVEPKEDPGGMDSYGGEEGNTGDTYE